MKKRKQLSTRHRTFVDRYMLDFNAVEAAKAAGYNAGGSKDRGVDRGVASHLLYREDIQAEISRRCLAVQLKFEVKRDHVLNGFAAIAFDPRERRDGGPAVAERIAALREIGKLEGFYRQVDGGAGLTLEQLLTAIAEKRAAQPALPQPLRVIEGGK